MLARLTKWLVGKQTLPMVKYEIFKIVTRELPQYGGENGYSDELLIRELISRGYVRPYKKTERRRKSTAAETVSADRFIQYPRTDPDKDPRPMSEWPTVTRESGLVERICEHGVGHPDPDYLANLQETDPEQGNVMGVHGCDGCCVSALMREHKEKSE